MIISKKIRIVYICLAICLAEQLRIVVTGILRKQTRLLKAGPPLASPLSVIQVDHLNSNSSRLPPWLIDYFTWHRATMQELNETNWDSYQYVLLRCVVGDQICFGASDRLKMVPVMVKLAAETNRLFLIHWSRPAPLEEFLIPNQINWTVPSWLIPKIDAEAVLPLWRYFVDGPFGPDNKEQVIRMRSMVHARGYYDGHRINLTTELSLWDVYHDIWNAMFLPSPAVQERIEQALHDLDLLVYDKKGHMVALKPYISAHIRSNYLQDTSHLHEEENAIRCAATLQRELALSLSSREDPFLNQIHINSTTEFWKTNIPIYVASDLSQVTRQAIVYGQQHQLKVVGRYIQLNASSPLHLDHDFFLYLRGFVSVSVGSMLYLGPWWIWCLGLKDGKWFPTVLQNHSSS
jgi:hypothetical protein